MAFMPTDEPIFLQFLIFYESVDCFRTAKHLWKDVTEELDKAYDQPQMSEEDEADDSMMSASEDDRSSEINDSFSSDASSNKSSMMSSDDAS